MPEPRFKFRPRPQLGAELALVVSYPTGTLLVTWDRPCGVFLPHPGTRRSDRRFLWDAMVAHVRAARLVVRARLGLGQTEEGP